MGSLVMRMISTSGIGWMFSFDVVAAFVSLQLELFSYLPSIFAGPR